MKIIDILNKRHTISFEIFPPKNKDTDLSSVYSTVDELAELKPDFISVTYGAGGSTAKNTGPIASYIKNEKGIESVAHLSCIDATSDNLKVILDDLKASNVENVLALRGDYPKGYNIEESPLQFSYASDLTSFIKENYGDAFCVSGACYPETHFEAKSFKEDLANLKKKCDNGAEYLVTQIFYDNDYYYRLVREARKIGINVPILAGIMPVTNAKGLRRTCEISNCSIPYRLSAMIDTFEGSDSAIREVGMTYATYQIIDLMTHGADGIHIYTMNKPENAKDILERLGSIRDEYTKG